MTRETIKYMGIYLIKIYIKRNIVESYHMPVYNIQIKLNVLYATHASFLRYVYFMQ